MARPRTPSNVLQMRGAFDKNPKRGREREGEPEANGEIGEPPESLSEDAKKCWFEIEGLLAPGVLCRSDRLALEMAASLLVQMREMKWVAPAALIARYEAQIGKFGMTPSDRSKVSVPKALQANPFTNFIKKGR